MKRILTMLLALCVLFLTLPHAAAAEVARIAEGRCGDDLTWVLTEDGTLRISGTGPMDDYDFMPSSGVWNSPWYGYREDIKTILVEDGVTHIGNEAFHYYYRNVTKISLPQTLTSIGDNAFYHCTGLPYIILPDRLTSIGEMAFAHCENMLSIEIPKSVTKLEDHAFFSCDSLIRVSLPGSIGVLNNNVFLDCCALRSIVIPEGITAIKDSVFGSCDLLEEVIIPDTVETIGSHVFSYCKNLKSICIPSSVTQIDAYTFDHCAALDRVVFLGDAPELGEGLFYTTATTVYYPGDNPTWTEELMHSYGGKITWIPYHAASEIASGWSGDTQWSLTNDGTLRIYGSGNMKNYEYSDSHPWEAYVQQINAVLVESGVSSIGECAFKGLTELESVTLPVSGLTRIGEAAFYGCTSLTEIVIPDTIYTVWAYTFKNCTALEAVTLPNSLVKIDQGAFEGCTSLPYMFIPGNTEIIGAWSFKGCTALAEVNMTWADVTHLREGCFKNCSGLITIRLPEDIRIFGDSAFYGIGTESLTVPATVIEIGPWCFARADLSEITFTGNAPTIGEGAFNKIDLTAYYPGDNSTWSAEVMDSYGGNIIWEAN